MKIKPTGDLVMVRVEKDEHEGKIIVPEVAKKVKQSGVVLAVGHGKRLKDGTLSAMEVKVGNTVLFTMYAGTDIKIEGESVKLIPHGDLLAVQGH